MKNKDFTKSILIQVHCDKEKSILILIEAHASRKKIIVKDSQIGWGGLQIWDKFKNI